LLAAPLTSVYKKKKKKNLVELIIKNKKHDVKTKSQLPFLCSKGISFKGLLSQWAGVILCFPSQLWQISINSDQVIGKLKHDSSSISSCS
jgi:hypothetical protein